MVRDKTFLDIVCNLDFGVRIGHIPMQKGIGSQRVLVCFDKLGIGNFVTKIHVCKGIREHVAVLVIEESEFIVAVHQAVH